jgi:endonuclease-3 related protein
VWRFRHTRALTAPERASIFAKRLIVNAIAAPATVVTLTGGPQISPSVERADASALLPQFFDAMYTALGPQHWWPASAEGGAFEVIVGAILTQSTAWTNVEKAIANLRRERLLTPRGLERVSLRKLARLVRPSGYFRQKAKKLKAFVEFLRGEYSGSLEKMFGTPTLELREKLLGVHGIGPETADSILLYAGNHPVFVVDAYTKRILMRHGLAGEKSGYEDLRALFESNLPREAALFNEYHGLLVHVGKYWCRPKEPRCEECPLGQFLPDGPAPLQQIRKRVPRSTAPRNSHRPVQVAEGRR